MPQLRSRLLPMSTTRLRQLSSKVRGPGQPDCQGLTGHRRTSLSCKPVNEARARIMSAIRGSRNRTTELRLATLLRQHRLNGWRRNLALQGRPDFVFVSERLTIFVDGCFWHGCPNCYRAPRHNRHFWAEKVRRNRARDRSVARRLRSRGWKVCRIWEHALSRPQHVTRRLLKMLGREGPHLRRKPAKKQAISRPTSKDTMVRSITVR